MPQATTTKAHQCHHVVVVVVAHTRIELLPQV